jgi:hypothetical protein
VLPSPPGHPEHDPALASALGAPTLDLPHRTGRPYAQYIAAIRQA